MEKSISGFYTAHDQYESVGQTSSASDEKFGNRSFDDEEEGHDSDNVGDTLFAIKEAKKMREQGRRDELQMLKDG